MTGRRMLATAAVSLALHVAAFVAIAMLPRVPLPAQDTEPPLASVELVMEEHKGDARPDARRPSEASKPEPPRPETPPEPTPGDRAPGDRAPGDRAPGDQAPGDQAPGDQAPGDQASVDPVKPEPPQRDPANTPDPPLPPAKPDPADPRQADMKPAAPGEAKETAHPTPRPAPPPPPDSPPDSPAPVITLNGTDSPSDALVQGPNVVPAAPDAVFHNRPPEYPADAARRGQAGTVILAIHISPSGTTAGVDVLSSSGYLLLDRAALDAVRRWRFLPEVRDGKPVASGMTMRFVFDNN